MVSTASRKETMITSSHYLPSFLFSRINKLHRDFLNLQLLALVWPPAKLLDIAFILSVFKLRANRCNNSQKCWELLAHNVASVCTGLKAITGF